MFEEGAVLVAGAGAPEARGEEQIGRLAGALLEADRTYVAEPRRVVQARDTALVFGSGGLNVVRRGGDGGWRYAIALLSTGEATPNEDGVMRLSETSLLIASAGARPPGPTRADSSRASSAAWSGSSAIAMSRRSRVEPAPPGRRVRHRGCRDPLRSVRLV